MTTKLPLLALCAVFCSIATGHAKDRLSIRMIEKNGNKYEKVEYSWANWVCSEFTAKNGIKAARKLNLKYFRTGNQADRRIKIGLPERIYMTDNYVGKVCRFIPKSESFGENKNIAVKDGGTQTLMETPKQVFYRRYAQNWWGVSSLKKCPKQAKLLLTELSYDKIYLDTIDVSFMVTNYFGRFKMDCGYFEKNTKPDDGGPPVKCKHRRS